MYLIFCLATLSLVGCSALRLPNTDINATTKNSYILNTNVEPVNNNAERIVDSTADVSDEMVIPASLVCMSDNSEAGYKKDYADFRWIKLETLDYFFNDDRIKALLQGNTMYQLCTYGYFNENLYFVIYRDLPRNDPTKNNIIGMWSRTNMYSGLVTAEIYNPSSGDIGLCSITGFVESGVLYNCGGGDGPFGFNSIYMLNLASGENTLIKNCDYYFANDNEDVDCSVDVLNIGNRVFQ